MVNSKAYSYERGYHDGLYSIRPTFEAHNYPEYCEGFVKGEADGGGNTPIEALKLSRKDKNIYDRLFFNIPEPYRNLIIKYPS